jgi:putative hydrolase of the HAD superfamily
MYKAIIFDLGRVLVNFDFTRGYRNLQPYCPYDVAEIPSRLRKTRLVEDFETGLVEPRNFVRQFGEILGFQVEYAPFCEIWSSIFAETLVPDSLLETLAARYRLVMLSNTNAIHFEMIRANYRLVRHFHELVLSYEVKAMKPRREIFEAAVARAGCRAEECFYTDDIPEFIAAAKTVGIDAAQFTGAERLMEELRARKII